MLQYTVEFNVSETEVTWKQGKNPPPMESKSIPEFIWYITFNELEKEIRKNPELNSTVYKKFLELKFPRPVYVTKNVDSTERIVCNTSVMEENVIYDIVWNGEKYGLRKTTKGVELLVFKEDPEQHE
jgi:hypothetical protein